MFLFYYPGATTIYPLLNIYINVFSFLRFGKSKAVYTASFVNEMDCYSCLAAAIVYLSFRVTMIKWSIHLEIIAWNLETDSQPICKVICFDRYVCYDPLWCHHLLWIHGMANWTRISPSFLKKKLITSSFLDKSHIFIVNILTY